MRIARVLFFLAITLLVSACQHTASYTPRGKSLSNDYATPTDNTDDSYYTSSGVTVHKFGNSYYGSDGSVTTQIGNTYYHSDGTTSVKYNDTFFNSDGTTSTRIGNTLFKSK
jgi:hypothetical protein